MLEFQKYQNQTKTKALVTENYDSRWDFMGYAEIFKWKEYLQLFIYT